MKKQLLLLALFTFSILLLNAQTWTWQNPLPQGNDIKASYFVDSNTGYLVGRYGTVIKTTNGASSWSLVNIEDATSLSGVYFLSSTTGYVCGQGEIYKTTNGGTSWENLFTSTSPSFKDIEFIDADNGFAVSTSGSALYKTTNGGTDWTPVSLTSTNGLIDIYFRSATHGYAVGEKGLYIYTTDGGATWTESTIGDFSRELQKIYFVDDNNAFVVGFYGSVFKSTDGGANWALYANSYDDPNHDTDNYIISTVSDVYFTSTTTGFIVGEYALWKTTDTGTTWVKKNHDAYINISVILPTGSATLYGAGESGLIIKSTDSGESWTYANTDSPETIMGVDFLNANLGYAVGDNNTILKTVNGGLTWTSVYNPTSGHKYFNGVDVLDENNIFIANESGSIFYSNDAGNTWESNSVGGYDDFFKIQMINATTGFACGEDGLLAKTTNGTDWETLTSPVSTDYNLNGLFFFDENNGFVIGGKYGEAKLYKTTNAGTSWSEITLSIAEEANSITFVSSTHGFLVADNAKVMYTTNGGDNWTEQTVTIPSGVYSDNLNSIEFFDANYGVIAGSGGLAFYTENAGSTWTVLDAITDNWLNDVAIAGTHAIFGGNNGNILKSTTNYTPPAIVADFSADLTSGEAPLTVTFTDESTGIATSWSWDFDNDGVEDADVKDPSYEYTTAGTYTVKLIVGDGTNTSVKTKADYIVVNEPVVAGIIASTTTGGYWNDEATWVGGVIPEATDSVSINGEVFVTENGECAYLIVNENGKLLNASSNYGIQLPVTGDVVNNGIITKNTEDVDNFTIKAYKNIVNNGSWDNQYIDLYGTSDQTISGTGEFGYMVIEDYDSTTSIIAGSNLTFNNTDVRLKRSNFIVGEGKTITVKNTIQANYTATIGNGKISGNGEIKFYDNTYLGEDTEVANMTLSGKTLVHYNVHFGENVIISDTLMQHPNNYPTTLYLDENFTNNAVVMDNPDDNDWLTIMAFKNITNNGVWNNYHTYLEGDNDQTVNCSENLIHKLYLSANVSGASTYQWKKDGVNIEGATHEEYYIQTMDATYSGVYTCTTDAGESRSITINAGTVDLVAGFSADVTSGETPLTVTFTDASSGNITSWSWDFNNDGIEDSDAQNPTFTYIAAGTYTVKLTVSNGSVSDEELKADYIEVNEPVGCLDPTNYSMGFESTDDLTGWTYLDVNNDDNTWLIADEYGVDNSWCAGYGYSADNAANDWLFTPCFDMEAGKTYKIEFKYAVAGSSFPEKLAVGFGKLASADMEIVLDLGAIDNEDFQTASYTAEISETDSYHFGWNCYSDANMWNLYIDDVKISETTAIHDQAIDENLVSLYPNPASTHIELSISNSINISDVSIYALNGAKVLSLNKTLNQSKLSIDISQLKTGIYFVKVTSSEGVVNKKLIVQ